MDLGSGAGRTTHHAPRRLAAEVGPERVVGVAEVGGVRTGVVRGRALAAEQPGEDDVVRHGPRGLDPVPPALVVVEDGAEVRLVLGVLLRLLDGDATFGEAGGRPHHAVEVPRVIEGADDGYAVHDLRQVRQVFAHVAAGELRADGLERAARLGGGRRLHVQRVELARPAEEVEEDDVLGAAEASFARRGSGCTGLEAEGVFEAEAECTQRADLEEVAPADAVTQSSGGTKDTKHAGTSNRSRWSIAYLVGRL